MLSYKGKPMQPQGGPKTKGSRGWMRRALAILIYHSSPSLGMHVLAAERPNNAQSIVQCRPYKISTGLATPSSGSGGHKVVVAGGFLGGGALGAEAFFWELWELF